MALIHCEIDKDYLKNKLREGKIKPFGNDPPLTEKDINESIRIVGQIGVDPFINALNEGAQVVLAGRACDTAIFASSAIKAGYDPGLAYHMAKIIECGAMCTIPLSASDVMVADINKDNIILDPPNPIRKCTVERVAAHTLYEQVNPYYIYEPDGEGEILEAIRRIVGKDIPIMVSLDLHANITEKMVKNTNGLFPFDNYPHTDMYDRGREASYFY